MTDPVVSVEAEIPQIIVQEVKKEIYLKFQLNGQDFRLLLDEKPESLSQLKQLSQEAILNLTGANEFTHVFCHTSRLDLKNGQPKQIIASDKQLLKIYASAESSEITFDLELLPKAKKVKAKKEPANHLQQPAVSKLYKPERNLPTDLYRFGFTVVGDMNVGKSCIMNTLVSGSFKDNLPNTIGANFGSHRFEIEPGKFI